MTENGLMLGAESAGEAAKLILNGQYKNVVSRHACWLDRRLIWETIQQAVSETASTQERRVFDGSTYDHAESGTLPAHPLV